MTGCRKEVGDYIDNDIPEKFESASIAEMYADLEADINLIRKNSPEAPPRKVEMMLHQKHKKFAFSYPSLFFKIVRGEIDPKMFKSLLNLKENLDANTISLDEARNRVIDCAKMDIHASKDKPSARKREKPKGTVVQELSIRCKPDDS